MNNFFAYLIHECTSTRNGFHRVNISINLDKLEEGSFDPERDPVSVKNRTHLCERERWMLARQDHKDSRRVIHV
jgi:hypothetical protein